MNVRAMTRVRVGFRVRVSVARVRAIIRNSVMVGVVDSSMARVRVQVRVRGGGRGQRCQVPGATSYCRPYTSKDITVRPYVPTEPP